MSVKGLAMSYNNLINNNLDVTEIDNMILEKNLKLRFLFNSSDVKMQSNEEKREFLLLIFNI